MYGEAAVVGGLGEVGVLEDADEGGGFVSGGGGGGHGWCQWDGRVR